MNWFDEGEARYTICGDDTAILSSILWPHLNEFVVPETIYSKEKKKLFRIIGIRESDFSSCFPNDIKIVSFSESSKIEAIPLSFFLSCEKIYFPPNLKRVKGDYCYNDRDKRIIKNKHPPKNRFFSVIWRRIVLNHFPLELVMKGVCRKCVYFRETIQIIGNYAFASNCKITTVVIPPSVEEIGDFSFNECVNLQKIIFTGKSKLKKIGMCAFRDTAIRQIEFPSSLEDTGLHIFYKNKKIEKVTFAKNSRLKIINRNAFSGSMIKSIEIPASLEVISFYAFYNCKELRTICFPKDSQLTKIEDFAFGFSSIESLDFPLSLLEIGKLAFVDCKNLTSISNMSPKIKSDERAFDGCTNLGTAEKINKEEKFNCCNTV